MTNEIPQISNEPPKAIACQSHRETQAHEKWEGFCSLVFSILFLYSFRI